jgi:hypothetical protein
MIDSLKRMLAYVNPGKFGQIVLNYIAFQSKAEQKETVKLDLNGYVIYVYKKAFNEPFPTEPNELQKQRINAIWDAVGHPEKKIS